MALSASEWVFCPGIGELADPSRFCCTLDTQDLCYDYYTFFDECPSGNCVEDCKNATWLYDPLSELPELSPFRKYWTCVNVPGVARLDQAGLLAASGSARVRDYIAESTTVADLRNITSTITQCLADTCSVARNSQQCFESCRPINLITNTTMPNLEGISTCIYDLCTANIDSLPFASEDIIGIGVFISYIMQCCIVVIITLAFAVNSLAKLGSHSDKVASKALRHEEALFTAAVEFHKAQCFFSLTIQIASMVYNIFDTNLLGTFLLLPLATNGMITVVLTYIVIVRYGRFSKYLTFLTVSAWVLSTVVFWVLYMRLHHFTDQDTRVTPGTSETYWEYSPLLFRFVGDLYSLESCGGHGGVLLCPESGYPWLALQDMISATDRMLQYPPFIWAWSTLCLLAVLIANFIPRSVSGIRRRIVGRRNSSRSKILRGVLSSIALFWLVVAISWVAIAFQFALLGVNGTLKVINTQDWGFGQIVAVAVWAGPLLEYLYLVYHGFVKDGIISGYLYRLAATLTVTRTETPNVHSLNLTEHRSPDAEKLPAGNALSERDSVEKQNTGADGIVR